MERDGNTGIFRLTSMSSASPHFPSLYTIRKCDFVGRYSNPNSDHGKSAVPGAPTSVLAADTERLKTSPPAVVATCWYLSLRCRYRRRATRFLLDVRWWYGRSFWELCALNARHGVIGAVLAVPRRRRRVDDNLMVGCSSSGGLVGCVFVATDEETNAPDRRCHVSFLRWHNIFLLLPWSSSRLDGLLLNLAVVRLHLLVGK